MWYQGVLHALATKTRQDPFRVLAVRKCPVWWNPLPVKSRAVISHLEGAEAEPNHDEAQKAKTVDKPPGDSVFHLEASVAHPCRNFQMMIWLWKTACA